LCQQVEFVNEQGLVLGPGEVKSLGRQELRDTVLLVGGIMLQLREAMKATDLEAREGGGRLDETRSIIATRALGGLKLTGIEDEAARKALCGLASRLNMTRGTVNGRVYRAELRRRRISLPT
jgi:hypothetical protein